MKNFIVSAIVLHFAITYLSCHAAAASVREAADMPPSLGKNITDENVREEIEKNRMFSTDSDGNEKVSTDEDAMRILEDIKSTGTVHFDEPHLERRLTKRHIIGQDDRVQITTTQQEDLPHSAIGFLHINDGSENGLACSAFLVGPRHLITAAHCVHTRGNTEAFFNPANLTFYLGRNCNSLGVEYKVTEIQTYESYRKNGSMDYDIAYLLLSSDASGWMGYTYLELPSRPAFEWPPVTKIPEQAGEVCGYPLDKQAVYRCLYCSRCTDVEKVYDVNSPVYRYTCDTNEGTSGGPLINFNQTSDSYNLVYGVNVGGNLNPWSKINYGTPITKKFFHDICRWKCKTGAKCSSLKQC